METLYKGIFTSNNKSFNSLFVDGSNSYIAKNIAKMNLAEENKPINSIMIVLEYLLDNLITFKIDKNAKDLIKIIINTLKNEDLSL